MFLYQYLYGENQTGYVVDIRKLHIQLMIEYHIN